MRCVPHEETDDLAALNLDGFVALVTTQSSSWIAAGATWTVNRSPDDGRNKHAAWVSIHHLDREGDLIVWDSGEAELLAGGPNVPLTQKHFEGLRVATAPLDELVALVIRRM